MKIPAFVLCCLMAFVPLIEAQSSLSFQQVDELAASGQRPDMVGVRALYLRYGYGVPQSLQNAEDSIPLESARHPFCLYNLAVLVTNRAALATSQQHSAELRRIADSLFAASIPGLQQLSQDGDPHAQLMLGGCYEGGKGGLPEDYVQAFELYKEAAKEDFPIAWYNLADLVHQGKGTDANPGLGVRLLEKAAERGVPVAKYKLAQAYLEGKGVSKNIRKGMELLETAATEHNHSLSQYDLGRILYDGKYGRADKKAGGGYIDRAINNLNASAAAFARKLGFQIPDKAILPDVVSRLANGDLPTGQPVPATSYLPQLTPQPAPAPEPVDPEALKFQERYAAKSKEVFSRLAGAIMKQAGATTPSVQGAVLELDPSGGKAADWIETAYASESLESREHPSFDKAISADRQFVFCSLDMLQLVPLLAENRHSEAQAKLAEFLNTPCSKAMQDAASSAFQELQSSIAGQIHKSDQLRNSAGLDAKNQRFQAAVDGLKEAMKIDLRKEDPAQLEHYNKEIKAKAFEQELGL